MKKIICFLALGIFLMSFVFATNGGQAQDTTGQHNDEIIANGGQGEILEPQQTQERMENTIQARKQIRDGRYQVEGKQIRIEQRINNKVRLRSQNISADTDLEFEEETTNSQTKLKAKLSNGRNAEIKIMPDTASVTALQRLRLRVCSLDNNCTIELKEVGEGNRTRVVYELKAEKRAKVFGLFRARMQVQSQIDAETGEVIQARRPWWAFLTTEDEEIVVEE